MWRILSGAADTRIGKMNALPLPSLSLTKDDLLPEVLVNLSIRHLCCDRRNVGTDSWMAVFCWLF